jgi:hypothetical protein
MDEKSFLLGENLSNTGGKKGTLGKSKRRPDESMWVNVKKLKNTYRKKP